MISASAASPSTHVDVAPPVESRLGRAVTWFITATISLMVILPMAQTAARLLKSGIASASSWTQHLTLWVGFLGAILATVAGQHLSLSTGTLIPAGKPRQGRNCCR